MLHKMETVSFYNVHNFASYRVAAAVCRTKKTNDSFKSIIEVWSDFVSLNLQSWSVQFTANGYNGKC